MNARFYCQQFFDFGSSSSPPLLGLIASANNIEYEWNGNLFEIPICSLGLIKHIVTFVAIGPISSIQLFYWLNLTIWAPQLVHGAEAIFSAMLTFDILAAIFMFSKTYTINILAQCWNAEIFDNIVTIWHSTNKKS